MSDAQGGGTQVAASADEQRLEFRWACFHLFEAEVDHLFAAGGEYLVDVLENGEGLIGAAL